MCNKKIYKTYFTFPALFFYILLFIIPVILNFVYSFTNWNAIKMTGETAKFIGLENYIEIFQDPELFRVIIRTLVFAIVTTVFKNVLGFLLALALNEGLKTRNILRAIFTSLGFLGSGSLLLFHKIKFDNYMAYFQFNQAQQGLIQFPFFYLFAVGRWT